MADKKTKREYFSEIVTLLTNSNRDDLASVITHEIELLDNKKANAKHTPSKATLEKRAENVRLGEIILTLLDKETYIGISEIKANENFNGFTSSKISAIIKPLVDSGKVEKKNEKKVVKYRLL